MLREKLSRIVRSEIGVVLASALIVCVFAGSGLKLGFRPADSLYVLMAQEEWGGWKAFFGLHIPGQPYVPLGMLSLRLDASLWPDRPIGYFLVNILLHSINCGLLYSLLRRRPGENSSIAIVSAFLFAISPAAATYLFAVTSRPAILSLTFFLLAAVSYCAADMKRSPWASRTGPISFACALLSCSWAVLTLPAFLLHACATGIRRNIVNTAPFVGITCAYLFFAYHHLQDRTFTAIPRLRPSTLLDSILVFPTTSPSMDLRAFLTACILLLAVLALPKLRTVWCPAFAVVWFVSGVFAAPATVPDPAGLHLDSMYLFLPGFAVLIGYFASVRLQTESRNVRVFIGLLLLGIATCHLKMTARYTVIAGDHLNSFDRLVDQIAGFMTRNKDKDLMVGVSLIPQEGQFTEQSGRYVDTLLHCRSNARTLRSHVMVGTPAYSWSSPENYEGLSGSLYAGKSLYEVSIKDADKLLFRPGTVFANLDPAGPVAIDLKTAREFSHQLGRRYPEWTHDLSEWQSHDAIISMDNGILRVECGRRDPFIVSPKFFWPPTAVERVRIVMSTIRPGRESWLRLYWESAASPGFGETRALNVDVPQGADEWQQIDVYLASEFPWLATRNITRIRLDPPPASIILLKSIALLPAKTSHVAKATRSVLLWDGSARGFQGSGAMSFRQLVAADQHACYTSQGDDPCFYSTVDLDPMIYDTVAITMESRIPPGEATSGRFGQVYWTTVKGREFSEARRMDFEIVPDGVERRYEIKLGRHFLWLSEGRVTSLRVDPMGSSGSFCVSRIELTGHEP